MSRCLEGHTPRRSPWLTAPVEEQVQVLGLWGLQSGFAEESACGRVACRIAGDARAAATAASQTAAGTTAAEVAVTAAATLVAELRRHDLQLQQPRRLLASTCRSFLMPSSTPRPGACRVGFLGPPLAVSGCGASKKP
jgi:hypothetical protein